METEPSPAFAVLTGRATLRLEGADARPFLQGLVSNDVMRADARTAVFAALLTPQGKVLFDLLISGQGTGLRLECAADRAEALAATLQRYRLRAKVTIAPGEEAVAALWGTKTLPPLPEGVAAFADPRLAAMGFRLYGPPAELESPPPGTFAATASGYLAHRLAEGVPEGACDLVPEQAFLLECNAEELHGVDFRKGCYVGQELTARMKHRGTARRRILLISGAEALPPPGTAILEGAREIGVLHSRLGGQGLGTVRLDRLAEGGAFTAGGIGISITAPPYPVPLGTGEPS